MLAFIQVIPALYVAGAAIVGGVAGWIKGRSKGKEEQKYIAVKYDAQVVVKDNEITQLKKANSLLKQMVKQIAAGTYVPKDEKEVEQVIKEHMRSAKENPEDRWGIIDQEEHQRFELLDFNNPVSSKEV